MVKFFKEKTVLILTFWVALVIIQKVLFAGATDVSRKMKG